MPTPDVQAEVENHAAHELPHVGRRAYDTDLLVLVMEQATKERKEQTRVFSEALNATREDFKASIDALRGDFRTFGVIMLLGILALAGVNVAINSGALNFSNGTPAKQGAAP